MDPEVTEFLAGVLSLGLAVFFIMAGLQLFKIRRALDEIVRLQKGEPEKKPVPSFLEMGKIK